MTHPDPNDLLQLALHEIPKEMRGSVLCHVMNCCPCQALTVRLYEKHRMAMREALIFSKLLGRAVTPAEILAGRRYN